MDTRTRRQKLEAMASQTVSPAEAAVARRMLARMTPERPSRRRRAYRVDIRPATNSGSPYGAPARVRVVFNASESAFGNSTSSEFFVWAARAAPDDSSTSDPATDWDGVE